MKSCQCVEKGFVFIVSVTSDYETLSASVQEAGLPPSLAADTRAIENNGRIA
jgi:hypothetical protein